MKKLTVFLLTAFLLAGLVLSAYAAEVPDPSRNGSLTLIMKWDKKPLNSGRMTLYRVGNITNDGADYTFTLIPELQDSKVSLKNLNDSELPQKLETLAIRKKLKPLTAKIREGKAVFDPLKPGLYVATQSQENACDGFEPIRPFLVSLPQWDGKAYQYDVKALPKVSLKKEPTEPTQAPTETEPKPEQSTGSKLPQTGQLNWPVPVMAVAGIALILAGWLLLSGKKARHEE